MLRPACGISRPLPPQATLAVDSTAAGVADDPHGRPLIHALISAVKSGTRHRCRPGPCEKADWLVAGLSEGGNSKSASTDDLFTTLAAPTHKQLTDEPLRVDPAHQRSHQK